MPDDTLLQKAGNGLLFNLSWLAIVTSQSLLIAPLVVVVHLTIHQLWIGRGLRELQFIAGCSLFGLLLDNLLFAVGVFTLDGRAALAPLWLTCLWPVLATTFDHAFASLQRQLTLAGILGGIGGIMSYYAGTSMSAIGFADPAYGLAIIGALWAGLFPAMAAMAQFWFRQEENRGEAHLA
ncbi:MAG: DUF2878 family protein [Halieaceae bacterium]|nr:DUF2878 family protein [Halieaceae bacterium]